MCGNAALVFLVNTSQSSHGGGYAFVSQTSFYTCSGTGASNFRMQHINMISNMPAADVLWLDQATQLCARIQCSEIGEEIE